MNRLDDAALVAAVRSGDDRGFELLFVRHRGRIAGYVARRVGDTDLADDITQDVFVSALRALRGADRVIAFEPWIYEVARNACIDHHRRVGRAGHVVSRDEPAVASCARSREDRTTAGLADRERLEVLSAALRQLPPRQRQLLAQRELGGLSYAQLAQLHDLTVAAVETALHRARRRLAGHFQLLGGELAAAARSRRSPATAQAA